MKWITASALAAVALAGCGGGTPAAHHPGTGARSTLGTPRRPLIRPRIAATRTPRQGCFSDPGSCGFPDPRHHNVGVSDCSRLPTWSPAQLPAGSYSVTGTTVAITVPNLTIRGRSIGDWQLYIDGAADFTLDGDCLSYDGQAVDSSTAVWSTGPGLTVENSTIIAPGCTTTATPCTSSAVDQTLVSGGAHTTIENDILAGAVEPVNGLGPGSLVQDSYIVANGVETEPHSEAVYEADIAGLTINHNTLLNPMDQSAVVYGDDPMQNGERRPCSNQLTITGNLMAGGGYILVSCAQASGPGSSVLDFSGNDIARCHGPVTFDAALGGRQCGATGPSAVGGTAVGAGADGRGFWPHGGFFGLIEDTYCPPTAGVRWTGNVWDGDGVAVTCS